MKTHTTRRPFLFALLLAGVAGTLTGSTSAVRAETVTSSSALAMTNDESGAATVKPYFWTELMRVAQQWQLISDDFPTHQNITALMGVSSPASKAISSRALD